MKRRRRRSERRAARYGRALARGVAPDHVPARLRRAVFTGCAAASVWMGHISLAEVPVPWRADVQRLLARAAEDGGNAPGWVVQILTWGTSRGRPPQESS